MVSMDPGESNSCESEPIAQSSDELGDDIMRTGLLLSDGDEPIADSDTWNRRIEAEVGRRLAQLRPAVHRIGRFTILESLGDGGMGAVYAAYDEQLDRKVAIKVLRGDDLPTEEERQRFHREALALARLSHPNVVTIHEVGEHHGEPFLAMEQVRGEDLAHWLTSKPTWPEVLEAFVQAGRGLIAAHEAGIVHRDLKPHNLMRSDDGVVKVVDFGLARVEVDEMDETVERGRSSASLINSLTLPGIVMGTPAYMSPEQHGSTSVDERSDQYGYCAALWQGLVGELPFTGTTVVELFESKLAGPPSWPDSAPAIPRRIIEALRRGLRPEPEDRWPSMVPLLDALSFDPAHRGVRRRRWLTGTSLLGLGALATWALLAPRADTCTGAERALAGIWDDGRRAEVETTILSIGKSYSTTAWERTRQGLDAYAEEWAAAHTQACEATAQGEQSPHLLDLKMGCLQRAAHGLTATVDTLADADEKVVDKARALVAGLPALSRCEDAEVLAAEVEPPLPQDAEAVDMARSQLARADTLRLAGRYDDSAEAIETAQHALEGVDYGPIATHVALAKGILFEKQGNYEASEASLAEALQHASRWRQHEPMAKAARWLMQVIGSSQKRTDEGLQYWRIARGLSEGHPAWEASARNGYGVVLRDAARYDEAEEQHRLAYQLQLDALGPDDPDLVVTRTNLVHVFYLQGKLDEALTELREVLALEIGNVGPDHPFVIQARANIAVILLKLGEYEEAATELQAALAWRNENLGAHHPQTGVGRVNLAAALRRLGRYDEAEMHARAGLSIADEALGSEHPSVAEARNGLATVLRGQGKYEEAEVQFRAALALWRKAFGPKHPKVAVGLNNLGSILLEMNRAAEAETHFREALVILVDVHGSDSAAAAQCRGNLAKALRARGRLEEAEAVVRGALVDIERALGSKHPSFAEIQNALGGILHAQQEFEQAEVEYRGALALRQELFDSDHIKIAESRTGLADVLLDLGRADDAVAQAEQAWSRRQRDDVPGDDRAKTAFVLARARWSASPPARAGARTLATDALRSYEAAGERFEDRAQRVQQWLDLHAPSDR
ncbi:MAG: serine/threonine-protein kinase [Deltaproteobacteria bacterium]|nr:serine/threonine-protein kinase [Deltaproteobacteria bacterium]